VITPVVPPWPLQSSLETMARVLLEPATGLTSIFLDRLRSLVRRSAKHHAEVTVDHAKRIFSRALKKLDTSHGHNPTLRAMIVHLLYLSPVSSCSTSTAICGGIDGARASYWASQYLLTEN
jgi:hypothetical protein